MTSEKVFFLKCHFFLNSFLLSYEKTNTKTVLQQRQEQSTNFVDTAYRRPDGK